MMYVHRVRDRLEKGGRHLKARMGRCPPWNYDILRLKHGLTSLPLVV